MPLIICKEIALPFEGKQQLGVIIMKNVQVSRASLSRLPLYLAYIKKIDSKNVSATIIADALGLGDVQVRKDLSSVCGFGRPKTGYVTSELIKQLESYLGYDRKTKCVIIGAGQLGMALLSHNGFDRYGLDITAAFDKKFSRALKLENNKYLLTMDEFADYCKDNNIRLGIIAVPENAAQEVCDIMAKNGIKAIWNFARRELDVPEDIVIQNEDLALSLAYLKKITEQPIP